MRFLILFLTITTLISMVPLAKAQDDYDPHRVENPAGTSLPDAGTASNSSDSNKPESQPSTTTTAPDSTPAPSEVPAKN